jgi:hypothetical protein
MLTLTKEQKTIGQGMINYRADSVGFITRILGLKPEYMWSKMLEVAESVRDNQLTAVPAGHSVSKTFGAGRIAVWFKTCFSPSTVITTAPSDNQVRNQLWREIHAAHAAAKTDLGGKMTSLKWELKPTADVLEQLPPEQREQWEKNFAIGFSTSPDTVTEHATKMQGWHNEWVLVIIDEACGIAPQIWRTVMKGLVTNERVKVLAIGNPTDPNCDFAKACEPESRWNVVRISCLDTPNYIENREVIKGLAGRQYVQDIIDDHGVDSNEYKIRVLGEFPTHVEGTFYGIQMTGLRRANRLGHFPYDELAPVYTAMDLGTIHNAIIFFQLIQERIRIIDFFYNNTGIGIAGIKKVLDTKPYVYTSHWVGADILKSNAKNPTTGTMVIDDAAALGLHLDVVVEEPFDNGIRLVRALFPKFDIHKPLTQDLVRAADKYKRKKDERLSEENRPVYHKDPVKDWTTHPMDALRHLGLAYRYGIVVDDQLVGWTGAHPEVNRKNQGVTDLLSVI